MFINLYMWYMFLKAIRIRSFNSVSLDLDIAALVWIMIGIHEKQKGVSSDEVWALIITVLVVGVLLLVFRIILLIYRNWNNAIYGKPSQENSS